MTTTVQQQMYDAALEQSEQLRRRQLEREQAWAEHVADAVAVVDEP